MNTDSFASGWILITFHLPPSFRLALFPAFTHQALSLLSKTHPLFSALLCLYMFFSQFPSQANLANSTPMTPVPPIHILPQCQSLFFLVNPSLLLISLESS